MRHVYPTTVLPELDFTEDDGSDPLFTNFFYYNEMKGSDLNRLSKSWLIYKGSEPIGYFSTTMSGIEVEAITQTEESSILKYPAMQILQIGVNKKLRKKQYGKQICQICIGMAKDIADKRIACRYLTLLVTNERVEFFQKVGFEKGIYQNKDVTWMFQKITN